MTLAAITTTPMIVSQKPSFPGRMPHDRSHGHSTGIATSNPVASVESGRKSTSIVNGRASCSP